MVALTRQNLSGKLIQKIGEETFGSFSNRVGNIQIVSTVFLLKNPPNELGEGDFPKENQFYDM